MFEKLEVVLNKFEEETQTPYYRQGSLIDTDELPNQFLTFWNSETPQSSFYDNEPSRAIWTWEIYFYFKNPKLLYTLPNKFIEIARENNFILQEEARDIASGVQGYLGRYLTIKYSELKEIKNGI